MGHLSITFHVAELQIQVPSGLTNIGVHMIIRKLNPVGRVRVNEDSQPKKQISGQMTVKF